MTFNNNEVIFEDHQYIEHDLETDTSLEKAVTELDPNCCAIEHRLIFSLLRNADRFGYSGVHYKHRTSIK